ncbi:MAG TPA: sigma 54-interacting transcriptional regulator [Symbiobacteriaceae bacterium]|nr:sigma 54-interacting transcriptional regulator [Symbiobacteriaceae bacterium]
MFVRYSNGLSPLGDKPRQRCLQMETAPLRTYAGMPCAALVCGRETALARKLLLVRWVPCLQREGVTMVEFSTRNPAMQELLKQAELLAKSEHTVLIQGESGTGKERLAKYIHTRSSRANGPFVKVDCTTIPDSLWESELFGYARGAFTGASREGKLGKFDLADGGTIFLDEIGEVPPAIQAKLLRVLQDSAFDPVGAVETRHVNVRVIAATNRDLAIAKEKGLFREDLYYRVGVITLTMPPLRKRKEDIELLTQELLVKLMDRGIAPPRLTAEAIGALLLYGWPGNIRELENVLKRAVVLAGIYGPIDVGHLPPEVAGQLLPPPPPELFRRYMKSAELHLLRWALASCNNERKRAAQFLGLSRAALYKKIKQYPEFATHVAEDEALYGTDEEDGE